MQDDSRGEPMVLLRLSENGEVQTLTIEQAHALSEKYGSVPPNKEDGAEYWWWELDELLEGIR